MQVLRDLDTSDLFLKIRALVFDITKKLLVRLLKFLIHLKDIFSTKRGAPLGAGPHSWEWVEWGQNRHWGGDSNKYLLGTLFLLIFGLLENQK